MSAFVVAVAVLSHVDVVLSIRAGAESYSETVPYCARWYQNAPGKLKAKMGWTSDERKKYFEDDPCGEVGLECCEGKCGLKGCEKELDCKGCNATMSTMTGLGADIQKAMCEDSQICSNEWFGHCIFLPTGCARKKQKCEDCTRSYSKSEEKDAKAACENPELCYLPAYGTYKEGGCNWNGDKKRCERGTPEIHDHYKPMFESN